MALAREQSGEQGTSLGQAAAGFWLLFDGLSLLFRERSLWRLALLPILLAVRFPKSA